MLSFRNIREHVINNLKKELSPALTYHNLSHTLDVLRQVIDIAKMEGVKDKEDLLLLKISALYHDVGFLKLYTGHEEISCEVAGTELFNFGFSKKQIAKVCGMMRATKVPQHPESLLQKILCDGSLTTWNYDGHTESLSTLPRSHNSNSRFL